MWRRKVCGKMSIFVPIFKSGGTFPLAALLPPPTPMQYVVELWERILSNVRRSSGGTIIIRHQISTTMSEAATDRTFRARKYSFFLQTPTSCSCRDILWCMNSNLLQSRKEVHDITVYVNYHRKVGSFSWKGGGVIWGHSLEIRRSWPPVDR